jgi:DNA-binding transcriptional regulator YhcF (GntR family)
MAATKITPMYPANNNVAIVKDIQENYATGYIKLYRSIRNHWVWEDPRKFQWWIDILMECNHDDKKVPIGFELFDCKRGQTLHSRLEWSKRWRVDESTVRRFLSMLEADGMIETENLKKTTRVTVCKYGSYNDSRPAKDQPNKSGASQAQDEQECKELEEVNSAFVEFWEKYDLKKGKIKAEKAFRSLSKSEQRNAIDYIPTYNGTLRDLQYKKHPTTYLHDKCWKDEVPTQTPTVPAYRNKNSFI